MKRVNYSQITKKHNEANVSRGQFHNYKSTLQVKPLFLQIHIILNSIEVFASTRYEPRPVLIMVSFASRTLHAQSTIVQTYICSFLVLNWPQNDYGPQKQTQNLPDKSPKRGSLRYREEDLQF